MKKSGELRSTWTKTVDPWWVAPDIRTALAHRASDADKAVDSIGKAGTREVKQQAALRAFGTLRIGGTTPTDALVTTTQNGGESNRTEHANLCRRNVSY